MGRQKGQELPAPSAGNDPTRIANAADYAGTYSDGARRLSIGAAADHLVLDYAGERIILDDRGGDYSYAAHPDFSRFLLHFGRDADERVVDVSSGADWYRSDRYADPTTFGVPVEGRAYAGHYRAQNPWVGNFRVVPRKGSLLLVGAEGFEGELAPVEGGDFYRFFTP